MYAFLSSVNISSDKMADKRAPPWLNVTKICCPLRQFSLIFLITFLYTHVAVELTSLAMALPLLAVLAISILNENNWRIDFSRNWLELLVLCHIENVIILSPFSRALTDEGNRFKNTQSNVQHHLILFNPLDAFLLLSLPLISHL